MDPNFAQAISDFDQRKAAFRDKVASQLTNETKERWGTLMHHLRRASDGDLAAKEELMEYMQTPGGAELILTCAHLGLVGAIDDLRTLKEQDDG